MPSVSEGYNTRSRKFFQNRGDRCHIMVRRLQNCRKNTPKAGVIFEPITPLLVRAGDNISSPNHRLLQKGGLPLDEAKVIDSSGEMQTLLQQALELSQERKIPLDAETTAETAPGQARPGESGEKAIAQIDADHFWHHQVWPAISTMLRSQTNLTVDQLAQDLGIEKPQAKAWLKRATEEGKVEKLNKPVRYVIHSFFNNSSPPLTSLTETELLWHCYL